MNQSKIEFEAAAWPNSGIMPPANDAPVRSTAEIVAPNRGLQLEGPFIASCVEPDGAHYLILDRRGAETFEVDKDVGSACIYQAFKSDLRIVPADWQWRG